MEYLKTILSEFKISNNSIFVEFDEKLFTNASNEKLFKVVDSNYGGFNNFISYNKFIPATCKLWEGDLTLHFVDGRHRTNYQINKKYKYILIFLDDKDIINLKKLGYIEIDTIRNKNYKIYEKNIKIK